MSGIYQFLFTTLPPNTHHQLNALETAGNMFLIPLAHVGGAFSIKYKEGESSSWSRVKAVALAIITSPLSVIGIILKGIGMILPHKTIHATDHTANIHLTSNQRIKEMYDQVDIMQKVMIENGFVENGIPKFFMVCGTALGAERHGGAIPWDDDVDMGTLDEEGFLKLKDKLKEAGLEMDERVRFNSLYKFRFTREKFQELYPDADYDSQAELDIFIMAKMADGSYAYDTKYARANWPTEYFAGEEIEGGFEMKEFGHIQLPGIKAPASYLKRSYGDTCLTHGIQTHAHHKFCGMVIPLPRCGTHYYEIQKYRQCALPEAAHPAYLDVPPPSAEYIAL
jgi:hypothetical protein